MKSYLDQRGFTLVQVVFVLVVLALLGAAMLRLSSVQSATGLFALQGARAYQAAYAGLEWGAARASAGQSCSGNFSLDSFTLQVDCNSKSFTEAGVTTWVYRINSVAIFGSYGSPDFVSRRLEMKMAL